MYLIKIRGRVKNWRRQAGLRGGTYKTAFWSYCHLLGVHTGYYTRPNYSTMSQQQSFTAFQKPQHKKITLHSMAKQTPKRKVSPVLHKLKRRVSEKRAMSWKQNLFITVLFCFGWYRTQNQKYQFLCAIESLELYHFPTSIAQSKQGPWYRDSSNTESSKKLSPLLAKWQHAWAYHRKTILGFLVMVWSRVMQARNYRLCRASGQLGTRRFSSVNSLLFFELAGRDMGSSTTSPLTSCNTFRTWSFAGYNLAAMGMWRWNTIKSTEERKKKVKRKTMRARPMLLFWMVERRRE